MAYYVQYDLSGIITGTVMNFVSAPIHPRQLVFSGWVNTDDMMVSGDKLVGYAAPVNGGKE